jgi:DNA polymerase bacteriophage-type
MAIVTIDFESYYDQGYSLRRISEAEYILSPQWQTLLCAIKLGDRPVFVTTGDEETRRALTTIDWGNAALLSHNTRFDGSILAWRYGYVPRLYLDTMSMANALTRPYAGSSSLKSVARYLGLPDKGDAVVRAMGKHLEDFTPGELAEYRDYCAHDNALCRTIFDRFMGEYKFPKSELKLIDLALRMFIMPQARLAATKLQVHLDSVRCEKSQALAKLEYMDRGVFSSNERFAQLLRAQGVDVPMKISTQTGELTYALARNDRAFKELCADPDLSPDVQAMLQIRTGEKSTIDETRSATLLKLARLDWQRSLFAGVHLGNGSMPVPYRYYGAHTGRFSGDGGFNFANLRRGSPIRDAIVAPEGWRVVHRDSSQIEARMLAQLAGCNALLDAFRQGRDVYSEFASRFYGHRVTREDVQHRFIGKTSVLGLGYGMGAERFKHTLFIGQGGMSADISGEDAVRLVRFYRETYAEIPALWRRAHAWLEHKLGDAITPDPLPVVTWADDAIVLPNGLAVRYPKLRQEWDSSKNGWQIFYEGPYGRKRIYGPKLIENITQALARIIVTDVMLRVACATGRHPVMSTYDSLDYVVREDDVYEFDKLLEHEFSVAPKWAEGLPLASEGGWGRTLLEAEQGVNR